MDSVLVPKIRSLISQLMLDDDVDVDAGYIVTLIMQIISLVSSVDFDSQPKPESQLMSLVSQSISVFSSMDLEAQPKPLSDLVSLITKKIYLHNSVDVSDSEFISLVRESLSLDPKPEVISLFNQILSLFATLEPEPELELEPESKLIKLLTEFVSSASPKTEGLSSANVRKENHKLAFVTQIISLVMSMDIDSQPKPESEFMSLVSQAVSIFNSVDLDSQPESLSNLIMLINEAVSVFNAMDLDSQQQPPWELISFIAQKIYLQEGFEGTTRQMVDAFASCISQTLVLEPEPELISLVYQIFSFVISMNSKWEKLISLNPRVKLKFKDGKVFEKVLLGRNSKWDCFPKNWTIFSSTRKDQNDEDTHFYCSGCRGQNHEEREKAPFEIKHPLHPKHFLKIAWLKRPRNNKSRCYCCDQYLKGVTYYCSACDFAIHFNCLEKQPVLSIDDLKWHEHTLALFSRTTSLTCDLCALPHSTGPLYTCPPCGFVVHQECLNLPHVIRISRHLQRISFTPSFKKGDWFCGVCRRKIDNDYGGYSCKKDGCSYAAHSKCATQENVWDGIDLEGIPEEIEEEVLEPFVRISDGIIQHFSHQHHHLGLDENTNRDYDDDKQCQGCVTPIYFGNFYSCLQCDYILHETCANLSRRIHHPIHPHLLTLVAEYDERYVNECSACPWMCLLGFSYVCTKCYFKLHVQCAMISDPLVHESHMHPLFLTSKPGERRMCCVCKGLGNAHANALDVGDPVRETFNCIECDFALCFGCATLPQVVRYKHDKHMLILSYGEDKSTVYWCEACEGEVNTKKRFYKCDEYCCVTLHIECLMGKDLYMKPNSNLFSVC